MKMEQEELISIVMLSRDNGQNVVESVKSVQAQTYPNWELLFVDDSSKDDTIHNIMMLFNKDKRLHVSQAVSSLGLGSNRLSALKSAKGKWVAFLDTGDLWEPNKLERQLSFMKDNDYRFSYTEYMKEIDDKGVKYIISGPDVLTNKKLKQYCWPGYLTVMCDKSLLESIRVNMYSENNDYALWLQMSRETNCYLLKECLATNRANKSFIKSLPIGEKMNWRYEIYSKVMGMNSLTAIWMTCRNLFFSLVKRVKYMRSV